MKLYLIRHAQSANNARGSETARAYDPPLTDLGKQQAELLARHLATAMDAEPRPGSNNIHDAQPYGITALYCSAMHRSLQTTLPIAEALGLVSEVWVEIHEQGGLYLDLGAERGCVGYRGRTRQQIQAEFPRCRLPDGITAEGWWNRGYEDVPACYERAYRVIARLRRLAASDGRIALISHGAFMDILLNVLFGRSHDSCFYFTHYNTAISKIDFRPDGKVALEYLNRVEHLLPDLLS